VVAPWFSCVLLGHSYAGVILTVVADRIPQFLRHIVYLDAMVPLPGECAMDVNPPPRRGAADIPRPSQQRRQRARARARAFRLGRRKTGFRPT
ncbi:MAG: hypothetical protein V8Q84_06055, partial [Bilophila sp.]